MIKVIFAFALMATPAIAQNAMDHANHMASEHMTAVLSEPGQGAFAVLEEVVKKLNADPMTDWSKVDIAGLREHLVDMDLVFTQAQVTVSKQTNGLTFDVTGQGRVTQAIQNMVPDHAQIMNGLDGWTYVAIAREKGATLQVTVPSRDMAKLTALGFFGIMALGGHHQNHHWAMAVGEDPHH